MTAKVSAPDDSAPTPFLCAQEREIKHRETVPTKLISFGHVPPKAFPAPHMATKLF